MSPAAARTSNEAIVAAARVLLEAGGPDAVTMQAVADAVGVRAPSLYKRFADRSALLTALADDVAADLAARGRAARHSSGTRGARCARWPPAIAHSPIGAPRAYQLLFGAAGTQPTSAANALAAAGVLQVAEALVGPADALEAARLLVAFAHGFVSMELAGAFRLGGDVDAAWDYALETLIRGLTSSAGLTTALGRRGSPGQRVCLVRIRPDMEEDDGRRAIRRRCRPTAARTARRRWPAPGCPRPRGMPRPPRHGYVVVPALDR